MQWDGVLQKETFSSLSGIAPPHANDTERAVGKYSAKLRAIFLSSLPCRVGMCSFFMKTTRIKHAKSVVVKVLATGLDLQLLYLLAVRTHITYLSHKSNPALSPRLAH